MCNKKSIFVLPNGDKGYVYRKLSNIVAADGQMRTMYVLFLIKDGSCVIHLD